MTEIGNGLEVRREPTDQPHQLDVALRLPLQPPTRGNAIEITVDVELKQHRRVIRGASGGRRIGAFEPAFSHNLGRKRYCSAPTQRIAPPRRVWALDPEHRSHENQA